MPGQVQGHGDPRGVARGLFRKRPLSREAGQASTEYALITAMFLGGMVMGWPFLVGLINALDTYFQSIYFCVQLAI